MRDDCAAWVAISRTEMASSSVAAATSRASSGSPSAARAAPPLRAVESGEAQASNLLQAAPKIDIIWNHDDDQGVGVKAAFDNANRDEFFFIGGAGSANAMRWIQDGDMEATVLYPPTQAADGIRLARLIAQGKGLSDLVQVEVPRRIVLNAPVVTADNVEDYIDLAFES